MDNQETVQAAIDSLRQDVEGLKTKLYLKDTKMELLLANLAKTEQELAIMQQQMDDVLLGSIATFAMPEPPEGWLICDGQEVSRQTFARLFAKIGTSFGRGDGESTFNLPDLRGVFVRGWDGKRAFGSHEDDQMQGHTHKDGGHSHQGETDEEGQHKHRGKSNEIGSHTHAIGEVQYPTFTSNPAYKKNDSLWACTSVGYKTIEAAYAGSHCHDLEINSAGSHSHDFTTDSASAIIGAPIALSHGTPRCGDETRPRNVALLFCIKY